MGGNHPQISSDMFRTYCSWLATTLRYPRICLRHIASGWHPPSDTLGLVSDIGQLVGNHPQISLDMFRTYCNWLATTLRYPRTCFRHIVSGWQPPSDILGHVSDIPQL